jgi:hypothetical protein
LIQLILSKKLKRQNTLIRCYSLSVRRSTPRMKLQVKSEPQNRRTAAYDELRPRGISNIEYRISNPPPADKCRRVESLRSVFYKMDRSTQKLTTGGIHYSMFDVGRSMFDVH